MSSPALLDHFCALDDPRQSWKVLYPLPEVLLVILCGTLAGADDFVEINDWGTQKLEFLKRLLPFENGIPSHDTLNDVMNALPSELFADCFASWDTTLAGTVGVDRSPCHHRRHGLSARHWGSYALLQCSARPRHPRDHR